MIIFKKYCWWYQTYINDVNDDQCGSLLVTAQSRVYAKHLTWGCIFGHCLVTVWSLTCFDHMMTTSITFPRYQHVNHMIIQFWRMNQSSPSRNMVVSCVEAHFQAVWWLQFDLLNHRWHQLVMLSRAQGLIATYDGKCETGTFGFNGCSCGQHHLWSCCSGLECFNGSHRCRTSGFTTVDGHRCHPWFWYTSRHSELGGQEGVVCWVFWSYE